MRHSVVTLFAVAALATFVVAQEPQRMFRSGVQTVPIYATVVDAAGRLVPDLKQEDFEVLDNGKPTPITLFVAETQPIAVVTAIDTSGSMTLVLDFVKEAAEAFVLRLLPKDRGLIATFDDRVRMGEEFTSNRDDLVRYLRTEVRYGNSTRLWDALYESAARLRKETSRKVVLVLSDGDDVESRMDGEAVLSLAREEHVMVYVIGLRTRLLLGQQWVNFRPDPFLRKLSQQTGGGHFEISGTTELNSTFSRVADELHRQYLIGIAPGVLDGKLHKLELRVKVPGMKARARQNYMATKDGAASQ